MSEFLNLVSEPPSFRAGFNHLVFHVFVPFLPGMVPGLFDRDLFLPRVYFSARPRECSTRPDVESPISNCTSLVLLDMT